MAGHLRRGIQGDGGRDGAGSHQAVRLQLRAAAGHGGQGGGEQRAVRRRHGEGVGAVPESGPHRVQEGVPVHGRGGGGGCGGGGCGCGHVRVGIREEAAERRHGDALQEGKRRGRLGVSHGLAHYGGPIMKNLPNEWRSA